MTGVETISKERQEQIDEGRTLRKDKVYNNEKEMARAASCILRESSTGWPDAWDISHFDRWMEKDRKEQLGIAGALIAAEIDRLS